jgi:hypothetical protein
MNKLHRGNPCAAAQQRQIEIDPDNLRAACNPASRIVDIDRLQAEACADIQDAERRGSWHSLEQGVRPVQFRPEVPLTLFNRVDERVRVFAESFPFDREAFLALQFARPWRAVREREIEGFDSEVAISVAELPVERQRKVEKDRHIVDDRIPRTTGRTFQHAGFYDFF